MLSETDGSQVGVCVLKFSHLQVKQLKMCHLGVSGLICTKLAHPKNFNKEPLHIEIFFVKNLESLREIQISKKKPIDKRICRRNYKEI